MVSNGFHLKYVLSVNEVPAFTAEALLARDKPGPKEGTRRGVEPQVVAALAERMAAQQFASAEQARRWLKKEHGVERP